MDFTEYAEQHGLPRRRVLVADWMDEHPDIAAQTVDAYRNGYAITSILRWLKDAANAPIAETPLRRWLRNNV